MKKSSDIRAALAEKQAEVQAIVELATAEEREVTDDEKQVIDRIQGIGDKPGEIEALSKDLERSIRFESRTKEIAASLFKPGQPDQEDGEHKPIVIPARARLHGRLVAFQGENAEENAYVSGRWIAANFFGHKPSMQWLENSGVMAAMSESEDDRGGIFVPTEMTLSIIRLVEEYGIFRQYSMQEPMGSDRKVVPVRVAGLTATPVAETSRANEGSNTVTAQDIIYSNIELVARKWKVVVKVSDELNEDTLISLAEQVVQEAATAFAYAEDNAGFNGDGTSTYHGITGVLNAVAAGSVHTALTGNTAFSTLDLADFLTMKGKLPRFPGIAPAWFISQEGYSDSIERLQMAAGGLTPADLSNGGTPRFLGAPVVITNVLNTTVAAQTETNILAYGDLRMASRFGDRRMMTMSLTDQRYWDEDQIAIKATSRFDINIHSTGTASAAGAILVLATPSS